jgi:hypothetical protein
MLGYRRVDDDGGLVRALARAQFGERELLLFERRGRWKNNVAHPVPMSGHRCARAPRRAGGGFLR